MRSSIILVAVLLMACERPTVEEYQEAITQCRSIGMTAYRPDFGPICCHSPQAYCEAWPSLTKKGN